MKYEILEAITEYYKDDEDLMADCLVYLSKITPSDFSYSCLDELVKRDRCVNCGSKLVEYSYKEYHPEIEGDIKFEVVRELACPNCDFS